MTRLRTMSPMDSFAWFDTPIETVFSFNTSGQLIAGVNPRRVALVIGKVATSITFNISTKPLADNNSGFVLTDSFTPIFISQAEYGPLVQGPWYAFCSSAGRLSVVEVLLRDWPDDYIPEE